LKREEIYKKRFTKKRIGSLLVIVFAATLLMWYNFGSIQAPEATIDWIDHQVREGALKQMQETTAPRYVVKGQAVHINISGGETIGFLLDDGTGQAYVDLTGTSDRPSSLSVGDQVTVTGIVRKRNYVPEDTYWYIKAVKVEKA